MFLVSLLGMSVTSAGAASFDCKKASTKIEHSICNDPELSKFDEEIALAFKSLDIEGRYHQGLVEAQRAWVKFERQDAAYDFESQRNFLLIGSALNSCSADPTFAFSDCDEVVHEVIQNCMALGNYTTWVMNSCGSGYLKVLETVDKVETDIWRILARDDQETSILFDKAYNIWQNFVNADCDWQYSEYRDGTIRQQIWLGCATGHYARRIDNLNSSNRLKD